MIYYQIGRTYDSRPLINGLALNVYRSLVLCRGVWYGISFLNVPMYDIMHPYTLTICTVYWQTCPNARGIWKL